MAGESIKDKGGIGETLDTQKKDNAAATTTTTVKSKKRGLMSRIWNGVFRVGGDDFEKRLQHISKEEASVLARMKKRSLSWRRTARHLIIFSVILEVIAVGYAIMTTKSLELNWKLRAFRVLPMFLLPFFSSVTYSALVRFTGMCDRKDQKTLERLRAERQAKIDELKEKTNYYSTQQLIQRYDPDPAAKAAAATVLASKLGADSGLKVHLGDESKLDAPGGRSSGVELVESSGLRNRKQLHTRSSSTESTVLHHSDEEMHGRAGGTDETSKHNQVVVEHHHHPGSTAHDGGWIARIAALLVGEDPTDSYALICGNCHMHNGLARKEDFPYITYYCPHCNALNMSKQPVERSSGSNSPNMGSSTIVGDDGKTMNSGVCSVNDGIHASSSTMAAAVETVEGSERVESTAPLS